MLKTVIDSYAWIEHFIGSEKGRKVDAILADADEIYTPDIVLAEIARKYIREGVEQGIVQQRLQQIVDVSIIICIDAKLALASAQCYQEMNATSRKIKSSLPGLFDAIVLAVGKSLKSKIVTGDQHFKNLPETLWVG